MRSDTNTITVMLLTVLHNNVLPALKDNYYYVLYTIEVVHFVYIKFAILTASHEFSPGDWPRISN